MWQEWVSIEQARKEALDASPVFISSGLLFHQDRDCVILVQSMCQDGSILSDAVRILASDIVKIIPLYMNANVQARLKRR
jgi:hypothetical protein